MSHSNNSGNHIKEQMKKAIRDNDNFAGEIGVHEKEIFRNLANKFIDATTYGQSIECAREFIHHIFHQNDKGFVNPLQESLMNTELYGDYDYKKQRLHYIHQVNVFLLGLFLYHKYPNIREKIDKEIDLTTSDINISALSQEYRYSGGSRLNEFLYRWKLASLSHDIGYGISLSENDDEKINTILNDMGFPQIRNNLDELWIFEGNNLLSKLDCSISEITIKDYMQNQYKNPFMNKIYRDHGLMSSLIFLRLMHQEYAKNRGYEYTESSQKIVWDERILSNSILQIAIAIAFHNLDHDSDQLKHNTENVKIFNIEKRPLAWLLKLSDTIQEWDKPKADDAIMNKTTELPSIHISFINNKIIVENFPSGKSKDVKNTISDHMYPSDLIEIIDT